MNIDDRRLMELLEESQDLHSDAMRRTVPALDEIVENHHSRTSGATAPDRRAFLNRGLFAAGTIGVGMGALFLARATTTVFADTSADVQILQTAASIENLAVAVYKQAAGLPPAVSGANNAVIAAFVTKTTAQHADHAAAFNAALAQMGATQQSKPDQKVLDSVVTPALAAIKGPADVVALALNLEDAAAQTYVKFGGEVDPKGAAFGPLATIAPVEAQHVAVLRAVKALLDAGAAQLIVLPADVAHLPAAAGDLGFPAAFYSTTLARSESEGQVS